MIQLLIALVAIGLIGGLAIWLVQYFGAPGIVQKLVVAVVVIAAVVAVLNAFGVHTGIPIGIHGQ